MQNSQIASPCFFSSAVSTNSQFGVKKAVNFFLSFYPSRSLLSLALPQCQFFQRFSLFISCSLSLSLLSRFIFLLLFFLSSLNRSGNERLMRILINQIRPDFIYFISSGRFIHSPGICFILRELKYVVCVCVCVCVCVLLAEGV